MMLAYQPVRALSTLNMILKQGLSAASRILPIIDQENEIKDNQEAKPLRIKNSEITFKDVNFSYEVMRSVDKPAKYLELPSEAVQLVPNH